LSVGFAKDREDERDAAPDWFRAVEVGFVGEEEEVFAIFDGPGDDGGAVEEDGGFGSGAEGEVDAVGSLFDVDVVIERGVFGGDGDIGGLVLSNHVYRFFNSSYLLLGSDVVYFSFLLFQ